MHPGWQQEHNPQRPVAGDSARLIVKPPAEDLAYRFINQIALHRLGRLVEDLVVTNRAAQLDILGVCPHQWTSRSGRLAAKKFQRRNVGGVPNLFGQQSAVPSGGVFNDGEKCLSLVAVPAREGIMGTLSGEQGPCATDAAAIQAAAIFMFAIAVALVPIPPPAPR